MAQQTINVGTVANDDTGDTLRAAMIKVQNNFSEVYANGGVAANYGNTIANTTANSILVAITNATFTSSLSPNTIKFGNATANVTANSILIGVTNSTFSSSLGPNTLLLGNATANVTANSILIGITNATFSSSLGPNTLLLGNATANVTANSILIGITNSTFSSSLGPNTLIVGNSTANTTANSILIGIANSTMSANLSPDTLMVGNATVNTTANSIFIKIANSTAIANLTPNSLVIGTSTVNATALVSSNTFNLGSANATNANGYCWLPNGLKMNWGWVSANATTLGAITFANGFITNAYIVVATGSALNATPTVISFTNAVANVATSSDVASNVRYIAIGA